MADGDSSDRMLIHIAIFCITMSIVSTCLVTVFIAGSSDYDYDTIGGYRSDLISFSGGQLVNDSPWVLTGVYTPFTPGTIPDNQIPDHIERDNGRGGWLYGQKITSYPYLGKVADIKLDPNQKSNQLLTVGDSQSWTYANGKEWWAGGNPFGIDLSGAGRGLIILWGNTPGDDYGVKYSTGTANNWAYTGYRYVFDPVLPFGDDEGSAKDGRLSLVWYSTQTDTGLSGALEVYSGSGGEQVKLGTIRASEIINAFRSTTGYVKIFDFNFEGVHLNLTIQFDPTVYNNYDSLQAAWNAGSWSLAISSASAGNFFDIEDSNAFAVTAGSAFDTFIKIYTFSYPKFDNAWADVIMWLIVGLPMTLAMLIIAMRVIGSVTRVFGSLGGLI